MNDARDAPQLVTANRQVLVMGGADHEGEDLDSVEELDEESWAWRRSEARMKEARVGFSAVVVDKSRVCNGVSLLDS